MNDVLPVMVATVAGAFLAAACSTGLSRRERKWVAASFLMHLGFASAQVPLTLGFYGGSDMFFYFSCGEIFAQMMERDPLHVIPEVTALLLQQKVHLPLATIVGAGSSTGSMSALAAWSFYVLGPSKYATCIVFAMLSLCGKIAIYRVFRSNLEPAFRLHAAIAALFVPSFVFWSSGLIKEAVVVAGFGWSLFGLHLWVRMGSTVRGWAIMVAGAIPILLIKAYVLLPLALAGGSWYYWARSLKQGRVRVRPSYFVVAALLGIGGIVLIGHYSPEYALDNLTARTSGLQQVGRYHQLHGVGGSHFALSDEIPSTLLGQLAYAPAALLASLFRPALFEVHNLLMLANAVETTVLTLLFARILFTRNLGNVRRQIADDPFLVFCLVFVVSFGIAVGLASTNLGTLSRYRCPILPFFAVLLLVLGKPLPARSPASTLRRAPKAALGSA
jgi:hypothetical protein